MRPASQQLAHADHCSSPYLIGQRFVQVRYLKTAYVGARTDGTDCRPSRKAIVRSQIVIFEKKNIVTNNSVFELPPTTSGDSVKKK